MFKSVVWIVFLSLLSMMHCAVIKRSGPLTGNPGVGVGASINQQPQPFYIDQATAGAALLATTRSLNTEIIEGISQLQQPLNIIQPTAGTATTFDRSNARSLSLGGGLHGIHNSALAVSAPGGPHIGNGYLGYANHHAAPPVVYEKALPVTTAVIPGPGTDFSVTPSISYGYSYKLVPTYAYAPAHPHKPSVFSGQALQGFNFNSLNGFFSHLASQASNLFARRAPYPNQIQPHHHHGHQHQHHGHQHPVQIVPSLPVQTVPVEYF